MGKGSGPDRGRADRPGGRFGGNQADTQCTSRDRDAVNPPDDRPDDGRRGSIRCIVNPRRAIAGGRVEPAGPVEVDRHRHLVADPDAGRAGSRAGSGAGRGGASRRSRGPRVRGDPPSRSRSHPAGADRRGDVGTRATCSGRRPRSTRPDRPARSARGDRGDHQAGRAHGIVTRIEVGPAVGHGAGDQRHRRLADEAGDESVRGGVVNVQRAARPGRPDPRRPPRSGRPGRGLRPGRG